MTGSHERTDRIQLGATYRDRLTGFTGVATGRYEYLTGCTRVTIQAPKLVDGKTVDITVDAPLLEFVEMTEPMRALRAEQRRAASADPSAAG